MLTGGSSDMPSAKRIELKLSYIQARYSKNEDILGARKTNYERGTYLQVTKAKPQEKTKQNKK